MLIVTRLYTEGPLKGKSVDVSDETLLSFGLHQSPQSFEVGNYSSHNSRYHYVVTKVEKIPEKIDPSLFAFTEY